ncbi:MAG: transcription elongation factor GreA [bacterium]|nr:transcription elongation factor GreA [bacterium]
MVEKIVTPAGYKKYLDELEQLKTVKRREIAERVKAAKEQGDLSENAEYAAAKDEQAYVEGRIEELEQTIKLVTVVEPKEKGGQVSIGSKITVSMGDQTMEYELVSSNESDPASGKISTESAVGTALLGKKKGDRVTVTTPGGDVDYSIEKVS